MNTFLSSQCSAPSMPMASCFARKVATAKPRHEDVDTEVFAPFHTLSVNQTSMQACGTRGAMQVQSELGVPADSASTALNVQDGTLTIHGPSSRQTSIPSDCLPRSRLFQDLVDSSDDSGVFHVPVVRTALELWMQYVQGNAQDLKRPRPEQNGGCSGLAEGQESGNGASAHEQDCGDGGSAAEREATSARYFLEGHMATAMNRGTSSHPRSSEEMTSEDVCVLMKVRRMHCRPHASSHALQIKTKQQHDGNCVSPRRLCACYIVC